MTRYALAIDLYDTQVEVDKQGSPTRVRANESRVFANRYRVGLSAETAGRAQGLRPDAVVSMRSCDYEGQQRCVLDGVEHMVESASDSGEFTRLTLKRRMANADD